jgi:hypothetical protein
VGDDERAARLFLRGWKSFSTLHARVAMWYDLVLATSAFQAWAPSQPRGSVSMPDPESGMAHLSTVPAAIAESWEVWIRRPDSWRCDYSDGLVAKSIILVRGVEYHRVVGTTISSNHSRNGETEEWRVRLALPLDPLLDPVWALNLSGLRANGVSRVAGRATTEYVGVPGPRDPGIPAGWEGAERYDFSLDSHRGVGLRLEAFFHDVPFRSSEVREIDFDEDLPDAIFDPAR